MLLFFFFFTRSMTNPLCHIDITFSVKLKEKLKTIKSILIILRPVRRGFVFFRSSFIFFLFSSLIKNESFVTHTHTYINVWVCAQPKLRVLRIFFTVTLFGHNSRAPPSQLISSLMMSYKLSQVKSLPVSITYLYTTKPFIN